MADVIKFKRGPKKAMPQEAEIGEPLYCTDTNELYIGTGEGVKLVGVIRAIDCGIFGDPEFDPERNNHYDGGTF